MLRAAFIAKEIAGDPARIGAFPTSACPSVPDAWPRHGQVFVPGASRPGSADPFYILCGRAPVLAVETCPTRTTVADLVERSGARYVVSRIP
jgi:hypothetical protein